MSKKLLDSNEIAGHYYDCWTQKLNSEDYGEYSNKRIESEEVLLM